MAQSYIPKHQRPFQPDGPPKPAADYHVRSSQFHELLCFCCRCVNSSEMVDPSTTLIVRLRWVLGRL
jgi:hypothetical protein